MSLINAVRMIIKRNLKTQMPSLKRCKLADSAGDDDESSLARKKRKTTNNGYYPLNLLGDVAAGLLPVNFHGLLSAGVSDKGFSASWCSEVSCSPVEVESKSKAENSVTAKEPRPPLVRTSRGRVQVLPSRFNDSVIENWRKESKTNNSRDDGFEEELDTGKEKFSFRTPKSYNQNTRKGRSDDKIGYKSRKYSALCEEEDEDEEEEEAGEEGVVRYRSFDSRKYSTSRGGGALTMRREQLMENERRRFVDLEEIDITGNDEKKGGVYGPEDFYAGDIVWAKAGRKEPFWPAIVIDPMTQAPELVLRSCIADAACVMFLGYSANENQRVYISYFHFRASLLFNMCF